MKPGRVAFALFAGYVLLCLALPEFHPFSKYGMYNRFPDSAYGFYVRSETGQTVPLKAHFSMGAAELGHLYGTVAHEHGFLFETDTADQLAVMGREMLERTLAGRKGPLPYRRLQLCRVHWYFNGQILQHHEQPLYATDIR